MDDREYLPLSWLGQVDYCPRRAALLLNERIWVENADTAKGRSEHERVHDQRVERRGDLLKLYEYTVFSDTLGLRGKCDCIEAQRWEQGCRIRAADFPVRLYPSIPSSTNMARCGRRVPTKFSSVRRPSVWKKCLQPPFPPAQSSLSLPIGAWRWSSRRSFAPPCRREQPHCGNCGIAFVFHPLYTGPNASVVPFESTVCRR